jgi:hypothetical protein
MLQHVFLFLSILTAAAKKLAGAADCSTEDSSAFGPSRFSVRNLLHSETSMTQILFQFQPEILRTFPIKRNK